MCSQVLMVGVAAAAAAQGAVETLAVDFRPGN